MISDKLVKEIHGLEIQWQVPNLVRTYSAVVLASKKDGISIKSYWKDEEERQDFISEWAKLTGKTKKEVIEMIEAPTFCFAHMSPGQKVEVSRMNIKNGYFTSSTNAGQPVCPFA